MKETHYDKIFTVHVRVNYFATEQGDIVVKAKDEEEAEGVAMSHLEDFSDEIKKAGLIGCEGWNLDEVEISNIKRV